MTLQFNNPPFLREGWGEINKKAFHRGRLFLYNRTFSIYDATVSFSLNFLFFDSLLKVS